MNLADYAQYDGLGLDALVTSGQVSPAELAALAIETVDSVDPRTNGVVETYPTRAEVLASTPPTSGPFAGVSFLLKDLGAAEAGQTQESGSRLLQGHRVEQAEGYLTQRFKAAGLTLLGRTATPEFALSPSTESLWAGATRTVHITRLLQRDRTAVRKRWPYLSVDQGRAGD